MTDADSTVEMLQDADGSRRDVAINAAQQLEGLCNALHGCAADSVLIGDNPVHVAAVIRALAIRGAVLARSTTAALGDAGASIDQLKEKVNHGKA
jgi:hypothetical protein